MAQSKRKTRYWSKRKIKLPKPKAKYRSAENGDEGFALRLLTEADQRYAVVKTMRNRLDALKTDAAINSVQQEWLAARAVFIVGYLESLELEALEGVQIDYRDYLTATRALSDVLSKLGLDKEQRSAQTLQAYIVNARDKAKEAKNGSKA